MKKPMTLPFFFETAENDPHASRFFNPCRVISLGFFSGKVCRVFEPGIEQTVQYDNRFLGKALEYTWD
jgi:hypothetical protein